MRYLILLFLIFAQPALAEKRVAFLVGNSAYEHAPELANPTRDVALIADTLKQLDFDVVSHADLGRNDIAHELSGFLQDTTGADVTIFYFAGHGMQYEGRNYLVGTDAKLQTEFDIDSETLQLNKVVQLLERHSRAALIFIDACRDNPLSNAFYTQNFSDTRAMATRGLVPISGTFQGSMITFSASPGQVAYDGTGENSPFAAALARHLPAENLEVLSLMKRVIRDVRSDTKDLQTPMVTNDMAKEVYLNEVEIDVAALTEEQRENSLFETASLLDNPNAWRVYLSAFPKGKFADAARDELSKFTVEQDEPVEKDPPISRMTTPVNKELVRQVQTQLGRLGCSAGGADGIWGQRSESALERFNTSFKGEESFDVVSSDLLLTLITITSPVCGATARTTTNTVPKKSCVSFNGTQICE